METDEQLEKRMTGRMIGRAGKGLTQKTEVLFLRSVCPVLSCLVLSEVVKGGQQ